MGNFMDFKDYFFFINRANILPTDKDVPPPQTLRVNRVCLSCSGYEGVTCES